MASNATTADTMILNTTGSTQASRSGWASLIGRFGLAGLFLWSGFGKFANAAGTAGYMQAYGIPAADLLVWLVALIEVVAGTMLAAGWKTRWAAVALIVFTLPATFIFHAYWGLAADQAMGQQIQFMKNLAIVGGLLSVFEHGAGRDALDRN